MWPFGSQLSAHELIDVYHISSWMGVVQVSFTQERKNTQAENVIMSHSNFHLGQKFKRWLQAVAHICAYTHTQ